MSGGAACAGFTGFCCVAGRVSTRKVLVFVLIGLKGGAFVGG